MKRIFFIVIVVVICFSCNQTADKFIFPKTEDQKKYAIVLNPDTEQYEIGFFKF